MSSLKLVNSNKNMSTYWTIHLMLCYLCIADKIKINIHALTAIAPDTPGGYIIGAQKLAINEINGNDSILSDYHLSLVVSDTDENEQKCVSLSLGLTQDDIYNKQNDTISIPIVLGLTYSSLSIATNPILSTFNWAQISSGSTSVLLSNTESYPTFYRTIASDYMQARGIALLCQQFNWTKIGILYTGDAFGVYLTQNLLELGNQYGFEAHAIAFADENYKSIINAVHTIQNIGVYIMVVIAHESELNVMFNLLDDNGLMGFPYYYLGVDAWLDSNMFKRISIKFNIRLPYHLHNIYRFDKARIDIGGLTDYSKGFIGTVPWYVLLFFFMVH